jgi:succinate dehydrogenase / fumarate reductase cytochrome b subunit
MEWVVDFVRSSIGRKFLMALTGLGFCGFLTVHLAGNLTMYGGANMLDTYASTLHSLGPLITLFELGLLAMAGLHISLALWLWAGNLAARSRNYALKKNEGGATLSSATMPYTGLLILAFLVIHLLQFRFVDLEQQPLSAIVTGVLARPAYAVLYLALMITVGLHVRHGFWSAFQTLGLHHPKYMPAIKIMSVLFGLLVAVGFGSLPLLVVMGGLG